MKRSTLVLLALGLGAFAGCTVNGTGLGGASGNTGGAAGDTGSGGQGGSATATSGTGGLGTGGGQGGDAATSSSDARRADAVPNSGGATGTGGVVGTGGTVASGGVTSGGGALGSGGSMGVDGGVATGGMSGTGGQTGSGGGIGGSPNPDGARDTVDARRDGSRDGTMDRGADTPLGSDAAPVLDTPPDVPYVESDGSYSGEAPLSEAGSPLVMVWSDEFNGEANTGIDLAKWSYVTWAPGQVNNEAQQYTSSLANVFQDGNGHLVIRGLYTAAATNPYTSGRIDTKGKVAFGPGHRIEVRARLPAGLGSFPALIMLGTSGTWPGNGELALMEQYGQDKSWFYATASAGSGAGSGTTSATKYSFPDAITASADFHVYALDWYFDHLVFQVDGNPIVSSNYATSSPFYNITEYIVLDVALGGDMGGAIDNNAFPMDMVMVVDYVRVYQF